MTTTDRRLKLSIPSLSALLWIIFISILITTAYLATQPGPTGMRAQRTLGLLLSNLLVAIGGLFLIRACLKTMRLGWISGIALCMSFPIVCGCAGFWAATLVSSFAYPAASIARMPDVYAFAFGTSYGVLAVGALYSSLFACFILLGYSALLSSRQ